MTVKISNIGYPRIGRNREWKKTIEAFWKNAKTEQELHQELEQLFFQQISIQKEKGIDLIPVGDFTFYDHILDTSFMFGIVPERFQKQNLAPLDLYFAMARGNEQAEACEMTKWFNTNYHYIVPEFNSAQPKLVENRPLAYWKKAKEALGVNGKAVLVGPATFVLLGKGYEAEEAPALIQKLTPLYIQVLQELQAAGVEWVQIDEPIFVTMKENAYWAEIEAAYKQIADAVSCLNIIVQTYFETVEDYQKVTSLPVDGFGLDFVHDEGQSKAAIQKHGFPADKYLFAGIIDGRNVWKSILSEKQALVQELLETVSADRLYIQPSSSLLHVPVTVASETELAEDIKQGLSFAEEKLEELLLLKQALNGEPVGLKEYEAKLQVFLQSPARHNETVRKELVSLTEKDVTRAPIAERQALQQAKFQLPLLPTTTIGSFPQTKEVRVNRLKWKKKELSDAQYEQYIQSEIKRWIDIQEEIGLDVLVHGEFERTDMVEFFGDKLDGFAVTKNGWVQSYGSRCVRPPVIYGDVALSEPMTVKESVYAQSLTEKQVKGMLTGPVTILNWSFPRVDIPRYDIMNQIGLAIRKEVKALEDQNIEMIQVDEPALREGLPIKEEKQVAYLKATVDAFKLSTTGVKDETQIHTHMCYSKFKDMINTIDALDADVISIEASRSHGNIIEAFEKFFYNKGIGLGVYDIHSPRIPSVDAMTENIERALIALDDNLFWVNPDCGLKTRNEQETIAALTKMVEAAKEYREKLAFVKA